MLIDDFGFTEESVSDAIGETIYLNEGDVLGEYKIVGFTYYDIAVISYEDGMCYGLYEYEEESYSVFVDRQYDYLEQWGISETLNALIMLEESREREVVNYCFENYPADSYISKYYLEIMNAESMEDAYEQWSLIHWVFSGIIALIVWGVNKDAICYNMRLIWDMGNYYVNRKRIMNGYVGLMLIEYVIMVCFFTIANTLLSHYAEPINRLLVRDGVVILIPLVISAMTAYREKK